MDDLGLPLFQETSRYVIYVYKYMLYHQKDRQKSKILLNGKLSGSVPVRSVNGFSQWLHTEKIHIIIGGISQLMEGITQLHPTAPLTHQVVILSTHAKDILTSECSKSFCSGLLYMNWHDHRYTYPRTYTHTHIYIYMYIYIYYTHWYVESGPYRCRCR